MIGKHDSAPDKKKILKKKKIAHTYFGLSCECSFHIRQQTLAACLSLSCKFMLFLRIRGRGPGGVQLTLFIVPFFFFQTHIYQHGATHFSEIFTQRNQEMSTIVSAH